MTTRKTTLFYAVLIAVASIAVGMVIASQWGLPQASSAQTINVPAANTAALNGPIDAQTFRNIAKAQSPTVVNIRTTARARGRELTEFFGGQDDLLQRFFGQGGQGGPGTQGRQRRTPREQDLPQQEGTGTGFIIDKAGFILTNNHVVEGADDIRVSLFGGGRAESYAAKVIGRDALTDTALIQLTEMPSAALQEAKFGDSAQMQPGDWVVAIGNPFGLAHTVTAGIVSARHREINQDPDARRFDDFLQTDAAINPGNSGGPLINLNGEVIGINTAINPRANTIGFAVPVNIAKDVLPQLRASGKVTRGWLGVYIQPIDSQMQELLGLDDTKGALVSKVEPGSPADTAGVKSGDVVVEFDGRKIEKMEELPRFVARAGVGEKLALVVMRKGDRKDLEVTLGELDADVEKASVEPSEESKPRYGLTVQDLTPEVAQQLGLEGSKGVLVAKVDPESAADEAGIRRRDVILEVNQKPIGSSKDFTKALEGSDKGALLLVRRGEAEIFVAVKQKG
jgi:serine protease Do